MLGSASVRALGLAAVLGVSTLVVPVAEPAFAAPTPKHVGIVIGDAYACVTWHSGITGDEVLNDVAAVHYRASDHLIDQINGVPSPPHADDTHYWVYWHDTIGSWAYSSSGASSYSPPAGTVEGWVYDDGGTDAPKPQAAPAGLYARICGAQDAPASPKPSPRSTSSTSRRPARPPVHAGADRSSSSVAPGSSAAAGTTRTNGVAAPASSSRGSRAHAERSGSAGAVGVAMLGPGSGSATSSAAPGLTRLAAKKHPHDGGGSSIATLIGLGLVALLGGAAAWAAARRGAERRADRS